MDNSECLHHVNGGDADSSELHFVDATSAQAAE